ncbi:hypothetical protein D3C81_2044950 [compost metagenome]
MVSVKLISAIPTAEGQSALNMSQAGRVSIGKPVGTSPTDDTPKRERSSRLMPTIPTATATRGAGRRGV